MAGVNPGGISRSNIGITRDHGWMALLAKHTKLIILCLHAKKLIYHVINWAKMVILWVNIRVRPPPSWNSVFGTTWLRFSSRSRFRTRARNLVGPRPDDTGQYKDSNVVDWLMAIFPIGWQRTATEAVSRVSSTKTLKRQARPSS